MGAVPFDAMLSERRTLPNGYLVREKSAQIWHAPPYPTPNVSPAAALRHRVERALENCAVWPTMALGAGALAAYFMAVAMGVAWRRKQIERLAAANVKEQPR
jgi:hypothetical protein